MIFESGAKAFIIAEVGSNWASLEDCLMSIRAAKDCGADAVKFQLYSWESLYGLPIYSNDMWADPETGKNNQQRRMEMNACLQIQDWLPQLKAEADKAGIEFMCSAFSPEFYDVVNEFVNIHKVASAEMTHIRILDKLKAYGKPVVLSTGASGLNDIRGAIDRLSPNRPILMYCVAAYPASEINLENINELSNTFNLPCGFSDHSVDVCVIPRMATNLGAVIIEKHFQAVDGRHPDTGHSVNPNQFKLMVESIRRGGQAKIGFTSEETEMLTRHNRRLIAIKDIKPGDTFRENENCGIYRSLHHDTHAFSPFMLDRVINKVALREIKAGHGIGPGDV